MKSTIFRNGSQGRGGSEKLCGLPQRPLSRFRCLVVAAACAAAIGGWGAFPQSATAAMSAGSGTAGAGAATSGPGVRGASRSSARVRHGGSSYRHGGSSYRHGYRGRSHYRSSFYLGLGFPWSWYGGYYGSYGYGPYGWAGYGPYGYGASDYYRGNAGALDLDIKPEEAQVYVDGDLVGIADNYDGFPRYLWLEAGTHNVVIYHDGLQTLGKQIKLSAGVVVRLKDQMIPGEAKPPQEMYAELGPLPSQKADSDAPERLAPWRFERRDERDERDEAKSNAADSEDRAPMRRSSRAGRTSARSEESWRQRRVAGRGSESSQMDFRSEPGQVEIVVRPMDAVVYIDGRLVGSGKDLADAESPLLVDPGSHTVEVSRPGYQDEKKEFTVGKGATERLTVELRRKGE